MFVSLNTCQDACLSPVILYLKISPTSWKKASLERGGTYDLQEKETSFKRQYQESYFNYGFIATGDSHGPNELGRIFGDKQMRPSKRLWHMETNLCVCFYAGCIILFPHIYPPTP